VGIVLAILFIWLCFLSLFFLLMKEHTVTGYVEVTVHGKGFYHSTLLPPGTMWIVSKQVNYARSLAAVA
jgi:Ni/Fe-hydrogenase subunit HybB-like protein